MIFPPQSAPGSASHRTSRRAGGRGLRGVGEPLMAATHNFGGAIVHATLLCYARPDPDAPHGFTLHLVEPEHKNFKNATEIGIDSFPVELL